MEGGGQVAALLDQHRVAVVFRQNSNGRAEPADDGSADENGFQLAGGGAGFEFRLDLDFHHAAVDLPPVGVPFHSDIHQPQRLLRGMGDVAGNQDGPGARAENGLLPSKRG